MARRPGFAVAIAALGLTACAKPPVQLASTYTPANAPFSGEQPGAIRPAPCQVLLASLQDLRDDPQAAGQIGYRFVHAGDALSWLRSGLLSIARDPRLDLSERTPADAADLAIRVDLLKLYMLPINEAKSATVVIRVHYADPPAQADTQVFRGTYTRLNWADSGGETQGAFDLALARVLDDVDHDLLNRCAAAQGKAGKGPSG